MDTQEMQSNGLVENGGRKWADAGNCISLYTFLF